MSNASLYAYDELSPSAQKNARQWWADNLDSSIADEEIELWRPYLGRMGFGYVNILHWLNEGGWHTVSFWGVYKYPYMPPDLKGADEGLQVIADELARLNEETERPLQGLLVSPNVGDATVSYNNIVGLNNHEGLGRLIWLVARLIENRIAVRRLRRSSEFSDNAIAEALLAGSYKFTADGKIWRENNHHNQATDEVYA